MTSNPETEIKDEKREVIIELSILPIISQGKSAIQLRKMIYDPEKIKEVLDTAFKEDYISARIVLKDKFKAYYRCIELGLLPKDPKLSD